MAGPQKTPSAADLPSRIIRRTPDRDEIEAEVLDPYAMGYEAAANLDEPPPCPFRDGIKARLWRNGFAARVQEYIGRRMSAGGLQVNLTS
jgi:hypothetical protein